MPPKDFDESSIRQADPRLAVVGAMARAFEEQLQRAGEAEGHEEQQAAFRDLKVAAEKIQDATLSLLEAEASEEDIDNMIASVDVAELPDETKAGLLSRLREIKARRTLEMER